MAEQTQPEESEFYLALLAAIEDHYAPAVSVQDADTYLSTQQILENLSGMYAIETEALSDFLLQSGYKFDLIGEMQFAWLLKAKN
jgi:hypothetical protein